MKKIVKIIYCLLIIAGLVGCATAYDRRGVYHVVQGGETMEKVARYYHVSVQELAEWNNIQDVSEIRDGLKLYIPKAAKTKTRHSRGRLASKDTKIKFERSRFIWPVNGEVSSAFGIRHGRRHDGVDIRAKGGIPILAAAPGKVAHSGKLQGYGNLIIISHKDRFFTVYAHNSKNLVKKGEKVAKGETIGYVGSTGRATGTHLHFEVRHGQKARNPLFFLPAENVKNVMIADEGVTKKKKGGKEGVKLSSREEPEEVSPPEEAAEKEKGGEEKVVEKDLTYREKMMEKLKSKKAKK